MSLSHRVIHALKNKAHCDVCTPHGAAILRNDIEKVTGQSLSLNSVKRLVGVLDYKGTPRLSTLEIIAQYLGFRNLEHLNHVETSYKGSRFLWEKPFLDARAEPIGQVLCIRWDNLYPKEIHSIAIEHLGDGKYRVRSSHKCKLQENDILQLSIVAVKYPLAISEVIRGEENLGTYIAGIEGGVTKVEERILSQGSASKQ